jgi:hypothetical protein
MSIPSPKRWLGPKVDADRVTGGLAQTPRGFRVVEQEAGGISMASLRMPCAAANSPVPFQ